MRRLGRYFEGREARRQRPPQTTAFTAETQRTQRKARFSGAIIFMGLIDEREFQKKSDAAFEALRKRLLEIGDENDFEVEGGSGKLEIEFEDEDETRFVISPNAPVRQIWISALTTSFKLGWSDAAQAFVQEKTGETLNQVMSRILTEKLGTAISV